MSDEPRNWHREALERELARIRELESLEARGELIDSPNPRSDRPLMKVSYKRKDETKWLPAYFSGFDDDTGYCEPVSTIYVETIHGIGCDICDKDDPPFLRIEKGDDEGADVCLGCLRLALDEYEENL